MERRTIIKFNQNEGTQMAKRFIGTEIVTSCRMEETEECLNSELTVPLYEKERAKN